MEYSYIDIILYHIFGCKYIQTQESEATEATITRLRNENDDNMRQLRDQKVFLIQEYCHDTTVPILALNHYVHIYSKKKLTEYRIKWKY